MRRIRLMLVDDQRLFVESLVHILKKVDRSIQVVGRAYDGREAVEEAARVSPDLVVMDIRMPSMNGVEAVKAIHERDPAVKIIMLTTYDDDEYVKDALRYGASGYLLKDIPIEELVAQIKGACWGNVAPISQSVLEKITHTMEAAGEPVPPPWFDELSKTERRILGLMVDGSSNDEIADAACLAEQTVRNAVHRIYEKLGVHDRREAVKLARPLRHLL